MRIGFGKDIHKLKEGLPLFLGSLLIPHHKGCVAHSDGDVLLHAICDALLGALGLGDIGKHFPDTDPSYKGIRSSLLLEEVNKKLAGAGYHIINIDCTVVLQTPKISPYVDEMRNNISIVLKIPVENISIKATTSEQLGYEGREEGVSACAVCLIDKR